MLEDIMKNMEYAAPKYDALQAVYDKLDAGYNSMRKVYNKIFSNYESASPQSAYEMAVGAGVDIADVHKHILESNFNGVFNAVSSHADGIIAGLPNKQILSLAAFGAKQAVSGAFSKDVRTLMKESAGDSVSDVRYGIQDTLNEFIGNVRRLYHSFISQFSPQLEYAGVDGRVHSIDDLVPRDAIYRNSNNGDYGRLRLGGYHHKDGSAFTLIELLVVVAITTLLAALLLPSLKQAMEKTKSAVCVSNLRQIGAAFSMYSADYNGYYAFSDVNSPNMTKTSTFASKLVPYLIAGNWEEFWSSHLDKKNIGVFRCPAWKEGEGNPPNFESPREPNRDYGANYFLATSSTNWNVSPVKTDFMIEESSNPWINWIAVDGAYTRVIADFNGPIVYANYENPTYWSPLSIQSRHSGTANFLFRDNSARPIKRP